MQPCTERTCNHTRVCKACTHAHTWKHHTLPCVQPHVHAIRHACNDPDPCNCAHVCNPTLNLRACKSATVPPRRPGPPLQTPTWALPLPGGQGGEGSHQPLGGSWYHNDLGGRGGPLGDPRRPRGDGRHSGDGQGTWVPFLLPAGYRGRVGVRRTPAGVGCWLRAGGTNGCSRVAGGAAVTTRGRPRGTRARSCPR